MPDVPHLARFSRDVGCRELHAWVKNNSSRRSRTNLLPPPYPLTHSPLMPQCSIEPLHHLHFPIRHARQLMPSPGPMHPTRNPNNLTPHPDLPQRRVQIRRLTKRNVLILIPKDLQKGWITLGNITNRRSHPECLRFPL